MDKTQALIKKFTQTTEYAVPSMNMGMPPMYVNRGVPHVGEPKGQDTVPAWLTPGEAVIPKEGVDAAPELVSQLIDTGRAIQDGAKYANKGLQLPDNIEEEVRVLRSIHGSDTEEVIKGLMVKLGMNREQAIMAIRNKNDGGIVYANTGNFSIFSPSTWFGGGNDSWVNDQMLDSLRGVESSNIHFDPSKAGTKGYDAKGYRLSDAGAIGAYQWMPKSAANAGYGVDAFDIYDESAQRKATRQYLEGIQKQHPDWSKQDVLMAYNYGPGNVSKMKAGKIDVAQIPKEALEYSGKVLGGMPKDYEGPKSLYEIVEDTSSPEYAQGLYNLDNQELIPPYTDAMTEKYSDYTGEPPKYGGIREDILFDKLNQKYKNKNNEKRGLFVDPSVKPSIKQIENENNKAIADLEAGRINNFQAAEIIKTNDEYLKRLIPEDKEANQIAIEKAEKKNEKKEINKDKKINTLKEKIKNTDNETLKEIYTNQINKLLDDDTYVDEYEYDPSTKTGEIPSVEGENIPDPANDQSNIQADNLINMHSGKYRYSQNLDDKITESQAIEAGKKAPKDLTDRVTGAFKNAFSSLFNEDELARMAIMYAGSRLFGYDHGSSIVWATKGYLNRISGIEQDKQAGIKSRSSNITESMRDDYKLSSIDKFIQTGNYDDLIFKKTGTGLTLDKVKGRMYLRGHGQINVYTGNDKVEYIKSPVDGKPIRASLLGPLLEQWNDDIHSDSAVTNTFKTLFEESMANANSELGLENEKKATIINSKLAAQAHTVYRDILRRNGMSVNDSNALKTNISYAIEDFTKQRAIWKQKGSQGIKPNFESFVQKAIWSPSTGLSQGLVANTSPSNLKTIQKKIRTELGLKSTEPDYNKNLKNAWQLYENAWIKLGVEGRNEWIDKTKGFNDNNKKKEKTWDPFTYWVNKTNESDLENILKS